MGIFDIIKHNDINKGVEEYRNSDNAVLIDVRTAEEYSAGHIPGSINVPLGSIYDIEDHVPDKNVPIFVHCLSGARSRAAAENLVDMGYSNVRNIGGINHYRGGLAI